MTVGYDEFLAAVSSTTGLKSGPAKLAAEATLGALACVLDATHRDRLQAGLPTELRTDVPITGDPRPWDEPTFINAVSMLTGRPPEQAGLQARAVLSTLAEQDADLVTRLGVPARLKGLFVLPAPGGVSGKQDRGRAGKV